jgi:hypothetical protein
VSSEGLCCYCGTYIAGSGTCARALKLQVAVRESGRVVQKSNAFSLSPSQVANNRSKALQMLLRAEELEAILARDNSNAADHVSVFAEVRDLAVNVVGTANWF